MVLTDAQKRAMKKYAEKNKDKIRAISRKASKKHYDQDKENTKNNLGLKGYIYCITNTITNEKYIGSTELSLAQRFRRHKACCSNKNKTQKLYENMRTHGKDNFICELVEEIKLDNPKELKVIEGEYIDKFDTIKKGLNCNYPTSGIDTSDKENYMRLYMRQYYKTPKGLEVYKRNNENIKINYHKNKKLINLTSSPSDSSPSESSPSESSPSENEKCDPVPSQSEK